MNDWFEWNGTKSTELGIYVTELPAITLPAEKSAFIDIPGRSGSLTMLEGDDVYADMTLSAVCFITDTSRITEIAAWLRGSGTVTFANRQGGFYYARIVNQIPIEKILRGNPACTFAVNFRCKPFFYKAEVGTTTLMNPGNIVNPFDFHAYPIITIYGSGKKQTLMVGEYSILIDDLRDHITIDCENMLAHIDGVNASRHLTLVDEVWPILTAGNNMVNWTSGIRRIEIKPNWRTL